MERRSLQLVEGRRGRPASAGARLVHTALDAHAESTPIGEANLGDQQRLAIVFQAAGLLAHLHHGGWHLTDGWRPAAVAPDGRLLVGDLGRGRDAALPQAHLLRVVRSLFGRERIRGRGKARRALRRLVERWQQMLAPVDLDRCVGAIFDAAPILWDEPFAVARQALVAIHLDDEQSTVWVAGPGPARRRTLAAGQDWEGVRRILASPQAASVWAGAAQLGGDPWQLAAAGRYRQAIQVWDRHALKKAADLEIFAESLFALGRFERALETLRGLRTPNARLLRIRCLAELGERGAAESAVGRLAQRDLDGPVTVQLAEVAVRLATLAGRDTVRRDWVARARAAGRGPWRVRASLVAGFAEYDAGLADAMDPHLDLPEAAMARPDIAWRWHHAKALQARLRSDGAKLVEHARHALAIDRRRLPRSTAGRLWSTMVVGYGLLDDLPRAEKAILHSLRLFAECDGPIGATLAWHNLAEVRVRRGHFNGVEAIVGTVLRQNRRARNARGSVRTLALRMRTALGRGRLAESLDFYRDALRELAGTGVDVAPLDVLAARVHGLDGRVTEAASLLGTCWEAAADLEPEERPALFALAGMPEEADRHAQDSPLAELWRPLLAGRRPNAEHWRALDRLEPYREARFLIDVERVMPGMTPPERLGRAIEILRDCGADAFAERLSAGGSGTWTLVEHFIEESAASPIEALANVLVRAGHEDARVEIITGDERRLLIAGAGGDDAFETRCSIGRLRVGTAHVSPALRCLLSLFAHFFERLPDSSLVSSHPAAEVSSSSVHGIIGDSPALIEALARLERLAAATLPVLVLGESGTGKELAACHVHRSSPRSEGPFIAVNCAALSESLILSDLFGHVRGAFTGADRDRLGVFESARGGTVFLDEVGDLPLSAQGMLLRVLQENEIRRLGETHSRLVDVRVVTATHRDLESMTKDGSFRQDLFFRLKVATVRLPPLRERGADVRLLADHFLSLARPGARISAPARQHLEGHDWPGNIRELRNVLEVAAALAQSEVVAVEHLDLPVSKKAERGQGDYHAEIEARRRTLVRQALEASDGNRAEAARRLGLSRQALSYLVRKLDLFDAL